MAGPRDKQLPAAKPTDISPEVLERFFEHSARDIELRRSEIDLRLQELKYNSAHAEKILGAQERDRENDRIHERKKALTSYIFAGSCIAGLLILIGVGMYTGKDQLTSDIIKIASSAVLGAFGGYGIAKTKSSDPPKSSE